jgi:hypothetical protein
MRPSDCLSPVLAALRVALVGAGAAAELARDDVVLLRPEAGLERPINVFAGSARRAGRAGDLNEPRAIMSF